MQLAGRKKQLWRTVCSMRQTRRNYYDCMESSSLNVWNEVPILAPLLVLIKAKGGYSLASCYDQLIAHLSKFRDQVDIGIGTKIEAVVNTFKL